MSSLNSRLKGFGFGKRKSSASIQPPGSASPNPSLLQSPTPPPGPPQIPPLFPSRPGPAPSSASHPSLMNHPGAGPRPPSYSANYPPGPPGPIGRTTSPHANQGPARTPPSQMVGGPPPINTGGAPVAGYPPPIMGGGPPPVPGGPPGYAGPTGYPPPAPPQPTGPLASYTRNAAAEVEGNSRSKAQLIVGIDFGTTFSGVAFAFATNNEAKEDIITEWPGAGSYTKQKIPTVLYYDQYQKVVGWGPDIADALAPTGYPKPGVQKVEWFKLQLMLSGNTYIDPINLPPLPPGKSEIDVAADYLFKLRQAMRAALQKTLGEVFNREERNIRYYLTVPAIWNDAGKAATRAAAIQAGFLRDENDNRLTLVSEPEAAALFCSKTGLLNLKVHDAVLIVDCGGGTVDLIAYEVEDENPFAVAECTAGSGDSCGSTALNRNFSNILRTKIRKMKLPDGSKTAGRVYAKCIMDFENRIKADFRNNGQKWAVDVGIEAEFPEAGIEEGYMTFTNEEILQCFEPVVNRILELVRNQIIAIQAQNRTLQNILVVGGFGASEYLFQQIKLHVPPQFQSKVVRPMDSVAAIVKGAVTAGITERVVTHRIARRHYLMATLQPFKEGYHPEAYRVPSLDGKDRCKFTRQIFVQKGQKVKIGEPVKVSFFRQVAPGATLMYEDILYACDDDVCPEYTKDPRIKEVVTLTSDLSRKNLEKDFERMDTPQGTFYRVYFDIYLTLDGSEFSAELVCQGELIVTNGCGESIWPGIVSQNGIGPEAGGFELTPHSSRVQFVSPDWEGRVWGRTNCSFNSDGSGPSTPDGVNGYGAACLTGDCSGKLNCQFAGQVPTTIAEFTLQGGSSKNQTFYDISLVDGYNLPLAIIHHPSPNNTWIPPNLTNCACIASAGHLSSSPSSSAYHTNTTYPMPYEPAQTNDTLQTWCPFDLQKFPLPNKPGNGIFPYPDDSLPRPAFQPCLSKCSATNAPRDCCTAGSYYHSPATCEPSLYSRRAKRVCPDAYSYAYNDGASTFVVPSGGGWEVRFCPGGRSTDILGTFGDEVATVGAGRGLSAVGWERHHLDQGVPKLALARGLAVDPAYRAVQRRVPLGAVDGVAFEAVLVEQHVDDLVVAPRRGLVVQMVAEHRGGGVEGARDGVVVVEERWGREQLREEVRVVAPAGFD
ncbi:Hsp70-like protein [Chaetomidium leptoderma]|uniref:Hsp70-like protein n=1 Tax=Chaetomidium leptoderma TaxID=669021 RepID=A0AAN6ZV45_9PEZI|nr:Hsp70-like protein [Chaetomidium leptoderma]